LLGGFTTAGEGNHWAFACVCIGDLCEIMKVGIEYGSDEIEMHADALVQGERVVLVEGLTGDEQAELAALRERVVGRLRDEPLRLNAAGEQAVAAGTAPTPEGVDPAALLGAGQLRVLVERDLVDVAGDAGLADDLERLAVLQRGADDETVAVFVGPLSARPDDQGSS